MREVPQTANDSIFAACSNLSSSQRVIIGGYSRREGGKGIRRRGTRGESTSTLFPPPPQWSAGQRQSMNDDRVRTMTNASLSCFH